MKAGQTVTVNSRTYDGAIRKSWPCKFSGSFGPLVHLTGEFDADLSHADLGLISGGTVTEEYFWLDRWYNVFRFYEPNGIFRNYYWNICMPATFANGVLDYVDLELDVVVWPDGNLKVLDEADFEESQKQYGFSNYVCLKAHQSLQEVIDLARAGEFPASLR